MICGDCREAADKVTTARKEDKLLSIDEWKVIKELHSFCSPGHCDCQHKFPVLIPQQRSATEDS